MVRGAGADPTLDVEGVDSAHKLQWVAWYNGRRVHEPLGYIPPAEFEPAYHDRQTAPAERAVLT